MKIFQETRNGYSGLKKVEVKSSSSQRETIYYHSDGSVYYKEFVIKDNQERVLFYKKTEPNDNGSNISIDSTLFTGDNDYVKSSYFYSDSKFYGINGLHRKVYSKETKEGLQKIVVKKMFDFSGEKDSVLFHTEELIHDLNSGLLETRFNRFEGSKSIESIKYFHNKKNQLVKENLYRNGELYRRNIYVNY